MINRSRSSTETGRSSRLNKRKIRQIKSVHCTVQNSTVKYSTKICRRRSSTETGSSSRKKIRQINQCATGTVQRSYLWLVGPTSMTVWLQLTQKRYADPQMHTGRHRCCIIVCSTLQWKYRKTRGRYTVLVQYAGNTAHLEQSKGLL